MDHHVVGSFQGDPMDIDPRGDTAMRPRAANHGTGHGDSDILSHHAPHSMRLGGPTAMDIAGPWATVSRSEPQGTGGSTAGGRPWVHDAWARSAESRLVSQPPSHTEPPALVGTEEWLMQRLLNEAEAAVRYLAQDLGPGPWVDVAAPGGPFRTPYTMWLDEGLRTRNLYADILRGSLNYSLPTKNLSEMLQVLQEVQCLPCPTSPPKSNYFFCLLDKVDGLLSHGRGRLGLSRKPGGFLVQHAISGATTDPELLPEPSSSLQTYFTGPDAGLAETLYDIYIHHEAVILRAKWETTMDVADLHRVSERKLEELQGNFQRVGRRGSSRLVDIQFLEHFEARVSDLEKALELDMETNLNPEPDKETNVDLELDTETILDLEIQRQIRAISPLQYPLRKPKAAFAHIVGLEHAFLTQAEPVYAMPSHTAEERHSQATQVVPGILRPPSDFSIDPHQSKDMPNKLRTKAVHFSHPIAIMVKDPPEPEVSPKYDSDDSPEIPTASSISPVADTLHDSEAEKGVANDGKIEKTDTGDRPYQTSRLRSIGSLFDTRISVGHNAIAADEWLTTYEDRTQTLLRARRSKDDLRVRIAVLDTGIDLGHPRIAKCRERIVECRSWVDEEENTGDVCGHGTHIASILLKLAPWAHLYVARVFKDGSEVGNAGVDAVVKAINHARTEWDVDMISLSFGYRSVKPEIEEAINACVQRRPPILVFAAAANTGAREDRPAFPARMGSVFCINSASGDGVASTYNPPMLRGEDNFTFLGEAITGAWPLALPINDDGSISSGSSSSSSRSPKRALSGTSFATPVAVSVAAAVLELCRQRPRAPELTEWCAARVRTYDGMREVLRAVMAAHEVREYMLIQPWLLLDAWEHADLEMARLAAARKLASVMIKAFGV